MVHEWALAEAIVASAVKASGGRRIKLVKIILGELQNADPQVLEFALEELKRGTPMEEAQVQLEVQPAECECGVCKSSWRLSDLSIGEGEREAIHFVPELVHAFVRCPSCGSPDFKVVKGRGVWIEGVEVE